MIQVGAKLDAGLHAGAKSPSPSQMKTLTTGATDDFAALLRQQRFLVKD